MYLKSLSNVLLLLLSSFYSFGQFKVTLQQAIDSTLSRNLQIKLAQLNSELSEENYKQAKYNLLPNLSATPQASFNWGRSLDVSTYNYITNRVFLVSGTLGTQVTLFQGGLLRKQILQNKLLLEADQSSILKIKYDLTLATATAYLQVLAGQDLLAAAQQQISLAKLNIDKVQISFDAGKKSIADLAQVQAQQANSELDEATIQNQLEISLLTLKQLMEMPTTKLELIRPNITQLSLQSYRDTSKLLQQALDISPDVRLAKLKTNAAYQNITLVKSTLYPSLSLFGSMGSNFSDARSLVTGIRQVGFDTIGVVNGTNQSVITPAYRSIVKSYPFIRQFSDNFYQYAGIGLQIPIFNRFSTQTNIRKAKITYQMAQANIQLAVSNLTKVVNQALSDVRTAEKRLAAAEANCGATRQVLDVSNKRYQAGLLNSIDYNTAITNANKAEFDLIQAKYDLVFKNKVIDYYLGRPLIFD